MLVSMMLVSILRAGPSSRRGGVVFPLARCCFAVLPPLPRTRYMHFSQPPANEDLWVFGYGSLMWRPEFEYLERVPARLVGLHRALCVYSFVHRGTPERPGLVLGLDRGGACRGIAYRVAAARRDTTLGYLRGREQVTAVYIEMMRRITLSPTPGRPQPADVMALVYVVDRSHPQYAGRLDLERQLHLIRQGHGRSGANRDYVLSAVAEIESQGCHDVSLHRLAERLKGGHEAHPPPRPAISHGPAA
jgi:glutathione-specific gamma-glutamylcyclotransferase